MVRLKKFQFGGEVRGLLQKAGDVKKRDTA